MLDLASIAIIVKQDGVVLVVCMYSFPLRRFRARPEIINRYHTAGPNEALVIKYLKNKENNKKANGKTENKQDERANRLLPKPICFSRSHKIYRCLCAQFFIECTISD
jgi:hypothetical protein